MERFSVLDSEMIEVYSTFDREKAILYFRYFAMTDGEAYLVYHCSLGNKIVRHKVTAYRRLFDN